MEWNYIPTVTDMDAYEDAVEAFERGGSRSEFMAKLLGLVAHAIRYLAGYPGRTMMVRSAQTWGKA
jgi:hypothetical protein